VTQLRIGLIGTVGRAACAQAWHDDKRARIVAGCDIEDAHLEAFRTKYGPDTFVTSEYRELCSRSDIDAVGVFTPDYMHAKPAIAALEAGKDVFLEKPMAISIKDCDAILAAQARSGRKLFMGFNMRYMPLVTTMKDIVAEGTIGEVKAVWVRHFQGRGGAAYFHDYRCVRDRAFSLLLQKASHDIDVIHYVTGQYTRRVVGMGGLDYYGGDKPNDLRCNDCAEKETCPDFHGASRKGKGHCCFRQEVSVEDHSMIMMELDGGARATYLQNHYCPIPEWRNYLFIGTKGSVESVGNDTVRLLTQKYNTRKTDREFSFRSADFDIGSESAAHSGADPLMLKAVLDYFVNGIAPKATPLDGRMSVATGIKAAESMRNGNAAYDIPISEFGTGAIPGCHNPVRRAKEPLRGSATRRTLSRKGT
jgi:predicted dehydrogenase